eukprot:2261082-Prymnesium_polylepis.1
MINASASWRSNVPRWLASAGAGCSKSGAALSSVARSDARAVAQSRGARQNAGTVQAYDAKELSLESDLIEGGRGSTVARSLHDRCATKSFAVPRLDEFVKPDLRLLKGCPPPGRVTTAFDNLPEGNQLVRLRRDLSDVCSLRLARRSSDSIFCTLARETNCSRAHRMATTSRST